MKTNFSSQNVRRFQRYSSVAGLVLLVLGLMLPIQAMAKTVTADVVILDHVLVFNRLGAQNVNGMVYALKRDVVVANAVMNLDVIIAGADGVVQTTAASDDVQVVPVGTTGLDSNQVIITPGPDGILQTTAGTGDVAAQVNAEAGTPLTTIPGQAAALVGSLQLRPDKRPRPLVLRVTAGDTLVVNFTNLLTPADNPNPPLPDEANPCVGCAGVNPLKALDNQVAGRQASFHVQGMQLGSSIADDGSFVGQNASSLVGSGGTATYRYFAEKEGTFLVTGMGATFGGEATGGNVGVGAFAAVNVQPTGARYYRSQVTEEELRLARTGTTTDGHPILPFGIPNQGYEATYPMTEPWISEGKAGLPILNMLDNNNNIVHSDLTAIIAGSNANGSFPASTYPLEAIGQRNPTVPNRLEPFREFTIIFHDETAAANAFPAWFDDNEAIGHTTHGVRDSFMINNGSGGIGSEIIANRLGVGPMWDCLDCAYEEFFLTSFTVGDPAMLVDNPANLGLENCGPAGGADCTDVGPKAMEAFYPADPANVYHTYTGDFTKIRNLHAGPKEQHIFHLHNHQWLFNANDDNSNYLDAQGIGPGSGYTYEINYGGSGNRNKTAGDAIFHCHFYPHFAQGMWALWRHHDVTETGTVLAVSGGTAEVPGIHTERFGLKSGMPAVGARALPDGEILAGTPIPAVVPMPGKPMAPMPAPVSIVTKNTNPGVDDDPVVGGIQEFPESSQAKVTRVDIDGDSSNGMQPKNPGFPFWIAGVDCGGPGADGLDDATGCKQGIVGQRPPTPPLDMLTLSDAIALKQTQANPLFQHPGFEAAAGGFDGGLPRHSLEGFTAVDDPAIAGLRDPDVVEQNQTRFDFRKVIHKAKPVYFPEQGTDLEQAAMAYHREKFHDTFLPDGTVVSAANPLNGTIKGFRTNGALPVPGAPFQEPCIDDEGDLFIGSGQFFAEQRTGAGQFFTASTGFPADSPRVYKAANIQIDAVFNKVGYHFPQQRIISLWGDVAATVTNQKPPEPFVIRMNTFDCTQYYHSNLVPNEYALDDFQVRTPTDIIGQHIHLPKWDLTTTDGAANGWNYEDGTLSPGSVIERITAINHYNDDPDFTAVPTIAKPDGTGGGKTELAEAAHPFFGDPGARTTIQRWFADPVVNTDLEDRGLGIIFTHDHYGPSTHQQVGLYGTVLTEPAGSTWKHNETGETLYGRADGDNDGGPTSWQALITGFAAGGAGQPASSEPYREFFLEFGDFQHAYEAGEVGILDVSAPDATAFRAAINPSVREEAIDGVLPDIVRFPPFCPGGVERPCPEAISADDVGMLVVNYRNESVGLRVFDPNNPDNLGPDGKEGTQTQGDAGDLAYALQTRTDRAIQPLNTVLGDTPYDALNSGVLPGDPFTPMLRTYSGDLVRVKIQAGATEHEHNAAIHGVKWLQGGSAFGAAPNSGWRNAQNDGISEQFSFTSPVNANLLQRQPTVDYAYSVDASQDGWWSGMWGVLRDYKEPQTDLEVLPSTTFVSDLDIINRRDFRNGVCPIDAPVRRFDISVVLANDVLDKPAGVIIPDNLPVEDGNGNLINDNVGGPLDPAGGTLVYNPRDSVAAFNGPLHDPTAMMYVMTADLEPVVRRCRGGARNPDCDVKLKDGAPIEPLVLRAAAGDCISVTLRNRLPDVAPDLAGYNTLMQMVLRDRNDAQGVTTFNNNLIRPSSNVGLHPQLVEYDISRSDGTNVGINSVQTAPATGRRRTQTYTWYAGHLELIKLGSASGEIVATPVEFGATNLLPADKIKQGQKGLVGALIIEPEGATWTEDTGTRAAATVYPGAGGEFRDFAVVFQKGLNLRYGDATPVENIAGEGGLIPEDSHDAGQAAINYGTEPAWFRFGLRANAPFGNEGGTSFGGQANAHMLYSNSLAGGQDPATPVFTATAGQEARMRVLMPTGVGRGTTFDLHGHLWQRAPYVEGAVPSQTIGWNWLGMYLGHQESVTPSAHFDVVLPSAGGTGGQQGDYLFRDHGSFGNTDGLWGIFRVE